MESYRDIIKSPIMTEKSSALAQNNVITFSVDTKANKIQIKQAIEEAFGVKQLKKYLMLKLKVLTQSM